MIINIAGMGAIICIIQIALLMGIALALELFHNRKVEHGRALPKYPKDYEVEKTPLSSHKELESDAPASLNFRLTWDFTIIFNFVVMIILLASVAICLPIGNSIHQSIRTRNFPTADGIVLLPLSYDEPVAYQYRVDGAELVSRGAYFGGGLSQNRSIEETYAKYPPETPVQVYYNPDDPSDSALERPDSKHWRDNLALGTILFATAAAIFGQRVWQSGQPTDASLKKRPRRPAS